MPATLDAPPVAEADPFSDLIGSKPDVPDLGTFADLVPSQPTFGAKVTRAEDYGLFHDLVPKSPTAETEKAVAATPVMSGFDKNFLAAEKGVSSLSGIPFHASMNALRSLSAGAGKYIFEGLEGFAQNRAKILANPPSELTAPQGDEIVLPDGSIMSQEQQNQLEQRYHDAAVAQIPDAKAQADYFKQIAQNADTSQYVDPELAKTIPARIAHAAGSAGVMALESLIPYAGIPLMVYHGALATEAEAKNAGKTDAEAEAAGVRSAIGLALFGSASKLAALGVAQILPSGASSLRTFLSQFTGQEIANETSSRAIDAWGAASDAPDGKKIEAALNALKDTTLEQSTLNTVYALAHASNAAGKEPARPANVPKPKIQAETPEITPTTAGEPIEQAPMAEVLKSEIQSQGEPTDAISQSTPMGLGENARRDESLGRAGETERMGNGESTVSQTSEEAAQVQEPIGIADAIAEIQRRNAPEPVPVDRVSDDPFVSRIANRFTEGRAKTGEIGEIAPGQGYATSDLVQRGLKMAPEEINQHVSDIMNDAGGDPIKQAAAIRAEEARLSDRSTELSRMAEANPRDLAARLAANSAFQDLTDFHNGPVAKLKQRFHATGMALQGEIPVDLSTVNGLREKWLKDNNKPPPASMDSTFSSTAENVRRATAEEKLATDKLGQEIEKATKGRKLPTADEVRSRIAERMKDDLPCRI